MLVEASGRAGGWKRPSARIIARAFSFADFDARADGSAHGVAAVPAEASGADLRTVVTAGFSRYPVYQGSIDGVVGVVHVKDLIAAMETRSRRDPRGRDRAPGDAGARDSAGGRPPRTSPHG
jgi:CBS domain containing-hemolysin-like protein